MEFLAHVVMAVFLITLIIVFAGLSLGILKLFWDVWQRGEE